nr:tRNAHis guanylyltransferase [Tanacetum cinerariifolium]
KLVSAICSVFSDTYVKKWKEYFPEKELEYAPRFDGRAVCYKSYEIRDYLSWRQVDCHKNTRSNTLFWARVHNGESRKRAQKNLEGREVMRERFQTLSQEFGIEYNQLPLMFRNGSSIFWDDK